MSAEPSINNNYRRDLAVVVVGSIILGALSTFGDWVWSRYLTDGDVLPGVFHGIVVFMAIAGVLTFAAGSRCQKSWLLVGLPVLGALIAGAFYPIARLVGYLAGLLVAWAAMWLGTASLQARARGGVEAVSMTLGRGMIAALLSALAFWSISGMWTGGSADVSYFTRFVYWTYAFMPGFAALLIGQPSPQLQR